MNFDIELVGKIGSMALIDKQNFGLHPYRKAFKRT